MTNTTQKASVQTSGMNELEKAKADYMDAFRHAQKVQTYEAQQAVNKAYKHYTSIALRYEQAKKLLGIGGVR